MKPHRKRNVQKGFPLRETRRGDSEKKRKEIMVGLFRRTSSRATNVEEVLGGKGNEEEYVRCERLSLRSPSGDTAIPRGKNKFLLKGRVDPVPAVGKTGDYPPLPPFLTRQGSGEEKDTRRETPERAMR